MNTLLIFFALPIAVIIVSAILQKVLKCPLAVAALIFAIFLVVTFAAFDATFLIATLAYTILAFITAIIVKLFCNESDDEDDDDSDCGCLSNLLNTNNNSNESYNGFGAIPLSKSDNKSSSTEIYSLNVSNSEIKF